MGHTHDVGICLIFWTSGAHCVRLSGSRLAVCENGDIVALHEGVDAVSDILKDTLLVNILAEYAVKYEDLLASCGVHGQTRG